MNIPSRSIKYVGSTSKISQPPVQPTPPHPICNVACAQVHVKIPCCVAPSTGASASERYHRAQLHPTPSFATYHDMRMPIKYTYNFPAASKYNKIHTYKYISIHTRKPVQIHTNTYKHIQTFTCIHKHTDLHAYIPAYLHIHTCYSYYMLPVVPHKAVAEVSE